MRTLLKFLKRWYVLSIFRRNRGSLTFWESDALELAELSGINTSSSTWYIELYHILYQNGFNEELRIVYDDCMITVGNEYCFTDELWTQVEAEVLG